MSSVVSVTVVGAHRSGPESCVATFAYTVRSLHRVRKAAKPLQRVTSKTVTVVHPPSVNDDGSTKAELRSQWRVILVPKGRLVEGTTDEYTPELCIECLAAVEGQADAAEVNGFRCVVSGPAISGGRAPELQAMRHGDSNQLVGALPDFVSVEEFDACDDNLTLTLTLDVLEAPPSAASTHQLFGSLMAAAHAVTRAVSVSEIRAASASLTAPSVARPPDSPTHGSTRAPIQDDASPAARPPPGAAAADDNTAREPSAESLAAAAEWRAAFRPLALDGEPFPPKWRGEEFAWCALLHEIVGFVASLPSDRSISVADSLVALEPFCAATRFDLKSYPLPSSGTIPTTVDECNRVKEAYPAGRAWTLHPQPWAQLLTIATVAAEIGPGCLRRDSTFAAGLRAMADGCRVPSLDVSKASALLMALTRVAEAALRPGQQEQTPSTRSWTPWRTYGAKWRSCGSPAARTRLRDWTTPPPSP
jgi:hypothetical protein